MSDGENDLTSADYEEVLADNRRLTRELDVALHGESGAARQASLCDLIGPARELRVENERLRTALELAILWLDSLEGALPYGTARGWPSYVEARKEIDAGVLG